MTDIWQKHAERERRRAQLERFNRWALAHKRQADLLALGLALLILAIATLIDKLLDLIARIVSR